MFTIEFDHLEWLSQFYSEWRQTSKLVNLKISTKVLVCDFGHNMKMTKTSQFCSIHQENTRKSCLQLNLIIFADLHIFAMNQDKLHKISKFSRFLLRSGYAIQFKICKRLKFLNSLPFTKKILVNHVYNWVWSFNWLWQFCSEWRQMSKN